MLEKIRQFFCHVWCGGGGWLAIIKATNCPRKVKVMYHSFGSNLLQTWRPWLFFCHICIPCKTRKSHHQTNINGSFPRITKHNIQLGIEQGFLFRGHRRGEGGGERYSRLCIVISRAKLTHNNESPLNFKLKKKIPGLN